MLHLIWSIIIGFIIGVCARFFYPGAVQLGFLYTTLLGIAGSFAGGLFVYLDEGTQTKPIHPAWAAHGGVLAADLAARGAEGPTTVLDGRFGLYHAYLGAEPGSIDLDDQTADLGRRWERNVADNPDQFHVVKAQRIEYLVPFLGTGELRVEMWVEKLGRTSCGLGFLFTSPDAGVVYARGARTIVKLDPETLRPAPWTDRFREAISALAREEGGRDGGE